MTDRDALWAAILANPDDDLPRLIYADWLDENGDKFDRLQARFIRAQVEFARTDPHGPERDRLRREVLPVEMAHAKTWAKWPAGLVLTSRFGRGFVEEVTMYSKRFVTEGESLFTVQPVRGVKFADMTGGRGVATPADLFACPHLARLHTVHFIGWPVDDSFAGHLTRSPHLSGLRCLRVGAGKLTPPGLRSILEATTLPTLSEFIASGSVNLGDNALVALAMSQQLTRIRVLEFQDCRVGAEGVRSLARSEYAVGLRVLRLGRIPSPVETPLRGSGSVLLAESRSLRGLEELALTGQELRKRGAEAFAKAYAWSGLRRLSLQGNGILASAIPAFAANPAFRSLAVFDLTNNPITTADLDPLRAACPNTVFMTDDTVRSTVLAHPSEDRP